MIQNQTILKVSDNSGAKSAKCIKVLGGFKRKYAKVGDIIVVSIQELREKNKKISKVKKGEVCKGLIIQTKKKHNTSKESYILNNNSIVLINKQNMPIGTRILGGLLNVFKKKKFQKFVSISAGIM